MKHAGYLVQCVFIVAVALLTLAALHSPSFGQDYSSYDTDAYLNSSVIELADSSTYELTQRLKIIRNGEDAFSDLKVYVVLIQDLPPIQEILEMTCSVPDYSVTIDSAGNEIAVFSLGDTMPEEEIVFTYTIKETGFSVIHSHYYVGYIPPFYLDAEETIESDDPRIRELAATLYDPQKDVWGNTRAIYDYVRTNVTYVDVSGTTRGALFVLENMSGDCDEISSLMIALLRASGIPARSVSSLLYENGSSEYYHGSLESYIPLVGWIPMDPTSGKTDYLKDIYFAGKSDDSIILMTRPSDVTNGYTRMLIRWSTPSDSEVGFDIDEAISITKAPSGQSRDSGAPNPERSIELNNLGVEYSQNGDYEEAIDAFTRALKEDPSNITALKNRANTYQKMERYEDAIDDLYAALEMEPSGTEIQDRIKNAYRNMAVLYSNRKEYNRAIVAYTKAINLDPGNAELYCYRGEDYYALEMYDKALIDFTEALRLNPRYERATTGLVNLHYTKGQAYLEGENYLAAIDEFTAVIALDPYYDLAYNQRGVAYTYIDQWDKAKKDFETACSMGNETACNNLINIR